MKISTLFILSIILISQVKTLHSQETKVENVNGYAGCTGEKNNQEVLKIQPAIVSQTADGTRYALKNGSETIDIVKVKGSAYDMGFAVGKLMKKEIQENVENFSKQIRNTIVDIFRVIKVPTFIADIFGDYSLQMFNGLLSLEAILTLKYVNKRFVEEMKGMADATSIDYELIRNINLVQELMQGAGASSMASAWGEATESSAFYVLRTLDWPASSAVNKHPLITVYNSNEEGSFPFMNIGYASLIGSITTINNQQVMITEKVWIPQEGQKVGWTYQGTPYQFALRDLAQFGNSNENIENMLQNTHRTVKIYPGFGSGKSQEYEIAEYSSSTLNIYNDYNFTQVYNSAHPQLKGTIFLDKYTQPSWNSCWGNIIHQNWRHINAETLYREMAGFGKSGSSQIVVGDMTNNIVYVAFENNGEQAYKRHFYQLDLSQYFSF